MSVTITVALIDFVASKSGAKMAALPIGQIIGAP